MPEEANYTLEAAFAFFLIVAAYKLYEMHCHLEMEDENEKNELR